MSAFAKKVTPIRPVTSAKSRNAGQAAFRESHQAVTAIGNTSPRIVRDFSQIPVRARAGDGVQLKKEVSAPADKCEQEAERVADAVIRLRDHETLAAAPGKTAPAARASGPRGGEKNASKKAIEDEVDVPVKKPGAVEKCSCEEDRHGAETGEISRSESSGADAPELEPGIKARIRTMHGGGQPLGSAERQFMERRFGFDFSAIRIHADHEADTCSRALQARAFTLGSHLFFRAGEYATGLSESSRLLAHELTHSIQQGAVVANTLEAGRIGAHSSAVLQRQPAPAPPVPAAPAAAPAGRATLNFLPILQDQSPGGWGVTVNDDPVFDITVYASGASWKCVITQADQQTHQGVHLLPGVAEVTPTLVAAETNCTTLKTMATSLSSVASQGPASGFYMLAAVQAHENVHVTQYRSGLATHYATLKVAVESLTVPLAGHDAASAKAAIKALPAFTTAMAAFHAGDVAVNNASGAHSPVAPFNTAEHGVVDPMVATIGARRTALSCPP